MITGTIDIADYIVDYVYSYTPGDIQYPPLENVIIMGIYKVKEFKPEEWRSEVIDRNSLIPSTIRIIEKKCKLDGIKKAITYNEIHV